MEASICDYLSDDERRRVAAEFIGELLLSAIERGSLSPMGDVLGDMGIPISIPPQGNLTDQQHEGDACCNCGDTKLDPYYIAVEKYRISEKTGEHLLICDHCNQLEWHKMYGEGMEGLFDAHFLGKLRTAAPAEAAK